MSCTARRGAAPAAAVILALLLGACGGGEGTAATAAPDAKASELGPSLEAQTERFLERQGTELDRVLRGFLGPGSDTRVEQGTAICRPGSQTASIENARRYPFACIVRASARAEGLEVEITLGFVGTELDGRCWRAANERFLVTGTKPTLLGRRALRPANRIAGCA